MSDPTLKQWFTFVDKDGNGSVSPYELQQALSQGGMHFSLQTTSSLVRMYDPASTGVVDFAGFERMHNFILQTQENFKIIDRNGDGKLSRTEVETALEQAAYDPACQGHLDMPGFVGLTIFLQSASGMFEGYAQGSSSINLTFDQFVYAASHCR